VARKNAKQKANKMRNAKRVWNGLVAKLSAETIPFTFTEEDAEDRYERHMKPIRMAQLSSNGIGARQSHTTGVILPASIQEPKL